MCRAGAFFLLIILCFPTLYAQEGDKPPEGGGDWDVYNKDSFTRGDQTFNISLGTIFPTVFLNNGTKIKNNFNPPVGGAGTLSYNYFFTRNFFLGGELSGSFISTIGKSMYYGILLGARGGYQFYLWRLEFPLSISVGMVWHRYLGYKNYGFYLKGGGAVYFRFNSDWSFGLNTNWYWLPQWTNDSRKNIDGNMIDLMLGARYHF